VGLNYHHLHYFFTVARAGTVAQAARELRMSESAVGQQVRELEKALGQRLFTRERKRLVLTDAGRLAEKYAEDIFRLGQEMERAIKDGRSGKAPRLEIGLVDDLPPLVSQNLIEPALAAVPGLHIVCRRGRMRTLLAALAVHEVDVVIADEPGAERVRVRAHDHLLGECGVSFLAVPRLAGLAKGFPKSLHGAPALLPYDTPLRIALDGWFRAQGVVPEVRGEFEDQALMRNFARRGVGFFASASVNEDEVRKHYGLEVIGRTDDVRERFYLVTVERRLRHPGVVAIAEAARTKLFG
jgi:LysR family transcriptional activator of nhaA